MKDLHDLISRLHGLKIELWDDDGYLGYSAPEGALTPELLGELREHKGEILKLLQQGRDAKPYQELTARPHPSKLPVSPAQRRLWFLTHLDGGNVAYNMPFVTVIEGPLDTSALSRSLEEILRRHESLRTTFCLEAEGPMQVIHPPAPLEIPTEDLGELSAAERDAELELRIDLDVHTPFDIERGPVLRVRLLRIANDHHVLCLVIHHIAGDGWSMGVFVRELAALYSAFAGLRPSPLPDPPLQYADFCRWQEERLSGNEGERQMAYWRKKLAHLEPLSLPTDRPRPATESFRGNHLVFHISREFTQSLRDLGRREGVTPYITTLAAFDVLLAHYSGQGDIAVSSGTANRKHPALEALIGFFVNTLVIRADLSDNPTFRALLSRVNVAVMEATEHEDLPFERVVEELRPERTAGHNPLAQVALTYHSFANLELTLPGLKTSRWEKIGFRTSKFDLMVFLTEANGGLEVVFEYNSDLFDPRTVERMSAHYQNVLREIVKDHDRPIGELPLLDDAERRQLVVDWNRTEAPFSSDACIHHLFEAQVDRDPSAVAVVDLCGHPQGKRGTPITYGELDRRANQMAHHLRRLGVSSEIRVGIFLSRGADLIVAVLGILKAGGAVVVLDPAHPKRRLELLLEDTGVSVLITRGPLLSALPATGARLVDFDQGFGGEPSHRPESAAGPENLACVLYTSGSTGTPNGALIEHRGLVNSVEAHIRIMEMGPSARLMHLFSFNFDAAMAHLFATICVGGALYLAPWGSDFLGRALLEMIDREAITHLPLVPSMLAALPDAELPSLGTLLVGGEKCSAELVAKWGRTRRFINAYGPTEVSILASFARCIPDGTTPSIGRPIANIQAYVVDRFGQIAPPGVIGELWLGGVGVARGYLNRPEISARKFIENPFVKGKGRVYRTGDLVRYRMTDSGPPVLEFVGRADDQVKINGQRIELAEAETALRASPLVRDAAVVVHRGAEGEDARLVGYVTPAGRPRNRPWELDQVASWTALSSRIDAAEEPDLSLDLRGWKSSYSGEDIPVEEMRGWAASTVARILDLAPRHVLEIGCGTGMLLARVAPRVQSYRGTDLAKHAIDHVGALKARLPGLENVLVSQQPAHDLTGLTEGRFDTVVLNSVVQYFPSAEYLVEILEGLLDLMGPTGSIFLGDIRSLALLETYHASVERFRAGGSPAHRDLRRRVQRALVRENELALHPGFFTALRAAFPRIVDVEIAPKRGHYRNELSLFRYDVTLRIGAVSPAHPPIEWLDAGSGGLTLEGLRQSIARSAPGYVFGLRGLSNARLREENALREWLSSADEGHPPTPAAAPAGWEPEALYALESELPCQVRLSWAAGRPDGSFDAVIIAGDSRPPPFPLDPPAMPARWSDLASDPMQERAHRELSATLRQHLGETLPPHLVPSAIVVLPSLPLTLNGKVDVRALPPPEARQDTLADASEPRNDTERKLATIWSSVLGLPRVGVRDNFFELGGHSLMAVKMMSRLEAELGQKLPLSALFQAPTIELLARRVMGSGPDGDRESPLLTPVQPHGERTPVLFFAPFSFQAVHFHEIGRRLAADQPFYLIHPVDIAAAFPDAIRMGELAARLADAIQERWPHGPYVLSGHSAGVLIALPVAVELEARGHLTTLVNMDMSAPRAGRPALERLAGDPALDDRLQRMVLDHVPQAPYKGRLLLLLAAEVGDDRHPLSLEDWQAFCVQPLQVFTVPGNHLTMVQEPNADAIVEHLRRAAGEALTNDPFPVAWDSPEEAREMWLLDEVHNLSQTSPLDFDLRLRPMLEGNSRAFTLYGVPLEIEPKLIHGFVYQKILLSDLPEGELAAALKHADQAVRKVSRDLSSRWNEAWLPEIKAHLVELTAFDPGSAALPMLLEHILSTSRRLLRLWEIHFELLTPVLVALSDFEEAYRDLFPDARPLEVYDLLAGLPNKTIETNLRLWQLGRAAARTPALRALLTTKDLAELPAELAKTLEGRALQGGIQDYVSMYGERSDDLYIDRPTWIDDPTPVLRSLREAVLSPDRDLAAELGQRAELREARLAEVRERLASHPPAVVEEFEALLSAAQMATVLSEDHHFWLDCKITYHARRVSLEAGKRLTERGVLEAPDDIFQLTLAELSALGSDLSADSSPLRASIGERRADAVRFAGVTPPPVLGVPGPLPTGESAIMNASFKFSGGFVGLPDNEGELRGMPGSGGLVKGPVRIVRTLADADALRPGDILVAPATLPSWTPFFATVAAVVTSAGGVLSHAAVVAREYGIPAVVGARGATEVLRDGQFIEVDGDRGVVRPAPR
jgi:amino acid adenylation domain-containing protein